jgi:hypothetical protein
MANETQQIGNVKQMASKHETNVDKPRDCRRH